MRTTPRARPRATRSSPPAPSAPAPSAPALPATLKALVREVEATLGQVVREAEGEALYAAVEEVRRHMVAFREAGAAGDAGEGGDARAQTRALEAARRVLERLGPGQRAALGRAYTLYLELVNVCENAYRTHRLRRRPAEAAAASEERAALTERDRPRGHVTWVLTAHPTESRSPENIRLLRRVQALLVRTLDLGEAPDPGQLAPLLHLTWRLGTHPRHKPTVEDEARHIYSLLDDLVLEALLHLARRGHRVRLRTWVGGDKDGHPGVGPAQTLASLQLSRDRLLSFVRGRLLPALTEDVALLEAPPAARALRRLSRALEALDRVRAGDGGRVAALNRALAALRARYAEAGGREHPRLTDLSRLLEQLPALVVPLELREERGRFTADAPIAAMLRALAGVSRGGRVNGYVRGCVVSMVTCPEDLLEAVDLVARTLPQRGTRQGRGEARRPTPAIPVIPLFELPEVLARAAEILEGALADPRFVVAAREHGGLEVMLGYSDTAKRMGVLASRLGVHDAMAALGRWARGRGLPLMFFHGSGGSEGRGGGTPEEQAATWPPDALGMVKTTLQGEMIERTLASPEILVSQVEKVAAVQAAPPAFAPPGDLARELGRRSQAAYMAFVRDPAFLDLLERATPYAHLGALNIGSRPARRGATKKRAADALDGLRAIPWVLCWTQTRLLLPVWLGVGTAWRALRGRQGGEAALRRAAQADPLLRAFLRLLGFTLAKTEPRVWREYVRRLAPDTPPGLLSRLEREWAAALDLVRRASPTGDLLPDRPWLRESIHYRAPMIHPLNLLQIDVLARATPSAADEALFRETVTGIAAGMLTTG